MQTATASHPFALMLDPAAVFLAIERSERLNRLETRVCRPLDKPLIPKVDDEVANFDAQVEKEAAV